MESMPSIIKQSSALLFLSSALLFAEEERPTKGKKRSFVPTQPVCEVECYEEVCPPEPCCCNPWTGFIRGEYLYWYAKENGLPLAMQIRVRQPREFPFPLNVPKEQHFIGSSSNSGVRLAAGFGDCCSQWDFLGQWTYLHNTHRQKLKTPSFAGSGGNGMPIQVGEEALISPWIYNGPLASDFLLFFDRIRTKWELTYNLFDVEAKRDFALTPCFHLSPYLGVRAAFTDVKFDLDQSTPNISFLFFSGIREMKTRFTNTFCGAGLLSGLDSTWFFSDCFAFYGGGDFALTWGEDRLERKERILFSQEGVIGINESYKTKDSHRGMQWMVDAQIGLRFETCFCSDSQVFRLDLGWEHQYWHDFVHRFQLDDVLRGGTNTDAPEFARKFFRKTEGISTDLVLGGFVLRAEWEF